LTTSPIVSLAATGISLDRNEVGALLIAAVLGPPTEHALIPLLALNGLKVNDRQNRGVALVPEKLFELEHN